MCSCGCVNTFLNQCWRLVHCTGMLVTAFLSAANRAPSILLTLIGRPIVALNRWHMTKSIVGWHMTKSIVGWHMTKEHWGITHDKEQLPAHMTKSCLPLMYYTHCPVHARENVSTLDSVISWPQHAAQSNHCSINFIVMLSPNQHNKGAYAQTWLLVPLLDDTTSMYLYKKRREEAIHTTHMCWVCLRGW